MCEGSGECGLAGWQRDAISAAAVCFECNLPPGSAGTQCVLGPVAHCVEINEIPEIHNTTAEEVTRSDLTQLSRVC